MTDNTRAKAAAPINVFALLKHVETDAPAPVYLFCPHKAPRARSATFEPFLAERAVERLIAGLVDPSMKDLAYASFYADETAPQEIVAEAQTFPFIAERRVLLVRNAECYEDENAAGPMLSYLASPADTTVLLLIASHVDKRTKFYKACASAGQIIECPELRERDAARWIEREIAARGKSIDTQAVQELIQRSGSRLSDVNNAINVVTAFVGTERRIRQEHVLRACADVAEDEIWALTNAIAASESGEALRTLRRLYALGKEAEELMVIINWLLNSAYAVAVAGDRQPKVSPFVAQKVTPLARRMGLRKLRQAFALHTETHFLMRSTGVNAELALELLVVKLATPEGDRDPA